jgi:biotin carboxyl carrier protein
MKLRLKIDDQSYEVEVGDLSTRPILATVDHETFEVWPEEAQPSTPVVISTPVSASPRPPVQSAPVPSQTPIASPADKTKVKLAPIPGTIVSVAVQAGDPVSPGQELLALEAMKMKNLIRADRPGKIAKVFVKPGDRVNQGQPLVEYAD